MSVSSYSESESDDEGILEIEEQLVTLTDTLEILLASIEDLDEELVSLERPLENIMLQQLGDVPYLKTSPFRTATFAFRPPGLPGINLKRRYKFEEICELLRKYLFQTKLIDANETIQMNQILKTLFGVKEDSISYISLIGKLRNVLI